MPIMEGRFIMYLSRDIDRIGCVDDLSKRNVFLALYVPYDSSVWHQSNIFLH